MRTFLESVNINSKNDLNTLMAPVVVYFKVTGGCNLKCPFCSQAKVQKVNMNLNDAKKLLIELKQMGVISINYTGGEPLVYPHIEELLKFGNSLGFEQTLITNAINLLRREKVIRYINNVGISLHGIPEVHDNLCNMSGAFKNVENSIDKLLKEYPHVNVNINYTLTKDNVDIKNLEFVKDFCKKKNIKLCFGRLNYLGLAKNEEILNPNSYLKIIYNLKNDYPKISISNCIANCVVDDKYRHLNHACGAGITIFSIEANGDVKICPSSNYVLGNAFISSFKKVINSSVIKKYKKLAWLPNCCRICKDFAYCKGGCHAEFNGEFYKNSCDSLVLNKMNLVWKEICNKKIISQCNKLRKENDKYLIIKVPLRKIDRMGYKILLKCDGNMTALEIEKAFSKVENIRDFLCALYIDEIIGVKYEKKND